MPIDRLPQTKDKKKRRTRIAEQNGHCAVRPGSMEPAPSDYPTPHSVLDADELMWDEDAQPVENYRALGQRLAATGDLYRRPGYASGLLLASDKPNIDPVVIDDASRLAAIVVDRVRVRVFKAGRSRGTRIPASHLGTMLVSEVFLQEFRPIDDIVRVAQYRPDFCAAQARLQRSRPWPTLPLRWSRAPNRAVARRHQCLS
jgi:hypothetical protein